MDRWWIIKEGNDIGPIPILAETGGIQPLRRRRSRLALTLAEREEISRGVALDTVVTRCGKMWRL